MSKSNLFHYFKNIFRKWVLWLFLLLDVGGAVAQFLIPDFNLPVNIYGFLAIIGFFWAGYQVYNESIESHQKIIKRLSDELNIDSILRTPKINIQLLEGSEYTFQLVVTDELYVAVTALTEVQKSPVKNRRAKNNEVNKEKYFIPPASIDVNVRIENLGCALNILVISADWDEAYKLPFSIYLSQVFVQNSTLQYPLHIEPDTFIECKLTSKITPKSFHTNAQFASRLRDFSDKDYFAKAKIWLEAVDGSGQRKEYSLESKISFRPLIDLYMIHWQEHGQKDLINLAGGVIQSKKAG